MLPVISYEYSLIDVGLFPLVIGNDAKISPYHPHCSISQDIRGRAPSELQ